MSETAALKATLQVLKSTFDYCDTHNFDLKPAHKQVNLSALVKLYRKTPDSELGSVIKLITGSDEFVRLLRDLEVRKRSKSKKKREDSSHKGVDEA